MVPAAGQPHVAILIGALMQEIRDTFAAEDWDGLRQSHFRLLSGVPASGISITELAAELGMTKQGCGQFVSFLTDAGHLTITADRQDARIKVVRRTASGDGVVRAVEQRIDRLERQWAERVGARRYATFRRVLSELHAAEQPPSETVSLESPARY